jgi:general secretion pathway protein M
MMAGPLALPDGRRGQVFALGLTAAAMALLWMVLLGPLTGWYAARSQELTQQRLLAAHMAALGQQIPALRAAVRASGLASAGPQDLLPGSSDAIAGANLQSSLQTLAAQAGTSLDSSALQPPVQAGTLRRISLQVSVSATWPVLIALLTAIDTASPRMIVDTLSVTGATPPSPDQEATIQANFTVAGFSDGGAH